jgi:hypothetical protein
MTAFSKWVIASESSLLRGHERWNVAAVSLASDRMRSYRFTWSGLGG